MPRQYYSDKYIKRSHDAAIDNDLLQQNQAREQQRDDEWQQRERDIERAEKECGQYPEASGEETGK